MVTTLLQQLQTAGRIRPLDLAFGQFVASHETAQPVCMGLLAAYLSSQLGEQDSCVEITHLGQPYADVFQFPDSDELIQILHDANSVLVTNDQQPGLNKPLVMDGSRLYLQRYWQYECDLAANIREKAHKQLDIDSAAARDILARLFVLEPAAKVIDGNEIDYQKVAVCLAASQQFSLITGGPGTGKTTTVTRLMALLQGLARLRGQVVNIHLVAPTGKAAARLTQSISQAKTQLPQDLQQDLPEQCSTIHRLLGAKPFSPYFKHNAHSRLHLDVLVLDEASMVDLPLMSKLFAALPDHAQIILLGDKDQLASVEAGSVLSDICIAALGGMSGNDALASQPAYSQRMLTLLTELSGYSLPSQSIAGGQISDNLVSLIKSHRFSANSGIGKLAKFINQGNYQQALALLEDENAEDIHCFTPDDPQQLVLQLMPLYQQYFAAVKQADVVKAFDCLAKQQVLCAHRSGDWGVVRLNGLIEKELHKQGLIDSSRDFYPGRPVMLSQNDHNLKLFNGDIGIVMADPAQPKLMKVWFISPEGQIRSIIPSRLPPHDTLYAMTIHKSQGSEFDTVYLCLPDNQYGAVKGLTRELVYTGLTRAKRQFNLYASKQVLQAGLRAQCRRGSGLSSRLV